MGLSTGIKAFNLHGSTLIYDPDLQLPNCVHTFLWATDEGAVDRYQTAIIGPTIAAEPNDPALLDEHLPRYLAWREKHGTQWLASEKPYYAARASEAIAEHARQEGRLRVQAVLKAAAEISGLDLAERHMRKVIDAGQHYRGLQRPTLRVRRRVTHCYACKARLDNSTDVECVSCGWILCPCGACGCGYMAF